MKCYNAFQHQDKSNENLLFFFFFFKLEHRKQSCLKLSLPDKLWGDKLLLLEYCYMSTFLYFQVIAATNRVDILDPALLRSGRLDRKIEFPMPNEEARARIMQIHSRKMNVSPDVNYEELARCTDDFNGAQCKAVCVEAGMIALRRGATELNHEDYMEGILEVQAKKKANLQYYA